MDTSNGYLNGLLNQPSNKTIAPIPMCNLDTSNTKKILDSTYILIKNGQNEKCNCGNNNGQIKYATLLSPPNSTNSIYGCLINNNNN